MDLLCIKKEEPVEYSLIVFNEDESLNEKPGNAEADNVNSMDIYTVTIKDEHTNNWIDYTDVPHAAVDSSCSEYRTEQEDSEDDSNESASSDEDWIFIENSTKIKSSKSKIGHRFCCYECKATFKNKCYLREHLTKHKRLADKKCCNVCKNFYSESIFELHSQMHKAPPYSCIATCGKVFTNRESFRCHIKTHRERKYECDICHKFFLSKARVSSHIETHIEREKSFECQVCKAAFFRKNTLRRHIRNLHLNLPRKKLVCPNPMCQREYVRSYDLKRHKCREKGKATPTRTYECDLCSKLYKGKRALIQHFANFHKINSLKNVPCNHCDKTFANNNMLSVHLRTHDVKVSCTFCRRLFHHKSICLKHERSCILRSNYAEDTDFDEFKCDICGCVFGGKFAIVEHMKIMHSTKSFSGRNFTKKFDCSMNREIVRQYRCCDKYYSGSTLNRKHVTTARCKFYCKKCRITFADLYSLLRHCSQHAMKVHQSLRHMQQCKDCDELFKWRCSIPEHLQSVII